MKKFLEWRIKDTFRPNSEIYFTEEFIGVKTQGGDTPQSLPGQTIYKVIANDEETNIVTLVDDKGKEYNFDQDELSKALSENSTMRGFQVLQYPIGYIMAGSGTELSKLSIYDSRLKGKEIKEKDVTRMFNAQGKHTS